MKPLLLLSLAVFALVRLSAAAPMKVDPETNMFVDETGRERFFHGLNVVYKHEPWAPMFSQFHPTLSFAERDYKFWKEWGFNVVRLGIQWPGYEPVAGQLQEEYMDMMLAGVQEAGKHGIYTLLDFHQDLLSEKFCGEGLPIWAVKPKHSGKMHDFPMPVHSGYDIDSYEVPSYDECQKVNWAVYMLSFETAEAFQALYDNENNVLDKMGFFWQTVARFFKNESSVLGYELMNEPNPGNFYNDLRQLLWSGTTDSRFLEPMYDKLAEYVRTEDQEHMIFFEPMVVNLGKNGFSHPPGGADYANRSALSFHYYMPHFMQKYMFGNFREGMQRLRIGGMLTEFDVRYQLPAEQENGKRDKVKTKPASELKIIEMCDEFLYSWIGWEYKPLFNKTGSGYYSVMNPDGTVNKEVLGTLSRTYAQAVAGRTQRMRFDNKTADFELEFVSNGVTNSEKSVIYLNKELHYEAGVDVSVSDARIQFAFQQDQPNYLELSTKENIEAGTTITLSIKRKAPVTQ